MMFEYNAFMVISTVNELIDELGGNKAVAKIFDVGHSAACNWRKAGRFPPKLHLRISDLAKKRRIKLAKDFFKEAAPSAGRT